MMDGVLLINKPAGMTSHDVINYLRKKYGQKKFGHTGTLDPNASGVLVVLAGKATKLLPFIQEQDKVYEAGMELGKMTDTLDIWGTVTETREIKPIENLAEITDSFIGKSRQLVPAVSAKKAGGKKLYEYHRAHQKVPELYQEIEIDSIEILDEKKLKFRIACSKGTYIRALVRDIAQKSGNLGVMSSLVRTKANGFDLDQCQDLEEEAKVWPMSAVLSMPLITKFDYTRVRDGRPIQLSIKADQAALIKEGELVAIYERKEGDQFVCRRGFQT